MDEWRIISMDSGRWESNTVVGGCVAWRNSFKIKISSLIQSLAMTGLFERQLLDRELALVEIIKREVDKVTLNPSVADRIVWVHENDGLFKVKKLHELLLSDGNFEVEGSFNFDKIWNLKVHPKVKYFLWILKLNRVPTKVFLKSRGITLSDAQTLCPWCGDVEENANHLWWNISGLNIQTVDEVFEFCYQCRWSGSIALAWFVSFATALWSLWLARNDYVFRNKGIKLKDLLVYVKMRVFAWCKALKEFTDLDKKCWWDRPAKSAAMYQASKIV
ncbi:uncharacterized protein LOC120163641 [Hibiscus syriacus]|uniref:uncharacterized protein LOC120163641 n=1 Tax=Hibiscus syriacus TaxID=106335 RepID=UPI0019233F43|nr:uncharacterized protein LOC120163641 [Hibiscus syriacus]